LDGFELADFLLTAGNGLVPVLALRVSKQVSAYASDCRKSKASEGNRTLNPRITNAVLCQLKLRWQREQL
jgi:hypothetical protein